jgi:hypothetical protein
MITLYWVSPMRHHETNEGIQKETFSDLSMDVAKKEMKLLLEHGLESWIVDDNNQYSIDRDHI